MKIDRCFNEKQLSVITGSMLGDGSLGIVKKQTRNSRFIENHGQDQYDWLDWKRSILEPLSTDIKERIVMARRRVNGVVANDPERGYKSFQLQTLSHPLFTSLERTWYKRDSNGDYLYRPVGKKLWRIKTLPPDLSLTELAIAVWFMDDGHNDVSCRRCLLHTLSFSRDEVGRLVELLRPHGLSDCKMSYRTDCENKPYIVIGSKSYLNFINIIQEQHIDVNSVNRKIDLSNYRPSWKESPNYHPRSLLNDYVVSCIMADAQNNMSQRQIAAHYGIHYKTINKLLRGHTLYRVEAKNDV